MPAGREEEARRFYRDILGLTEVPKPAVLAPRGGCWFESDGVKLHLGVEKDFRPARKAHPAFLVHDLQALALTLREHGHTSVEDQPLAGCERLHVHDPFGNRIELMQACPNG